MPGFKVGEQMLAELKTFICPALFEVFSSRGGRPEREELGRDPSLVTGIRDSGCWIKIRNCGRGIAALGHAAFLGGTVPLARAVSSISSNGGK